MTIMTASRLRSAADSAVGIKPTAKTSRRNAGSARRNFVRETGECCLRSQVEGRAEDELTRVDDAVGVGGAVGVDRDFLQATVLQHVADIKLHLGAHAILEEAEAVTRRKIHGKTRAVVDGLIGVERAYDAVSCEPSTVTTEIWPARPEASAAEMQPSAPGSLMGKTVSRPGNRPSMSRITGRTA